MSNKKGNRKEPPKDRKYTGCLDPVFGFVDFKFFK